MGIDSIAHADSDGEGDGDSDGDGGGSSGGSSGSGGSSESGQTSGAGDGTPSGYNRKLKNLHEGVRNKTLLPLSVLKAIVISRYGNSIIDIETDRKSGKWIYEFKLINREGHLLEVYVNGHNGRIVRVKND